VERGGALRIAWLLAAALAAIVIRGLVSRETETYTKVMAARIKSKLRLLVFDKILRLGPGYMTQSAAAK
jgi:ABC-type transport system involved in cytochrome bd biosynthesis fused ATPase/permease subunit